MFSLPCAARACLELLRRYGLSVHSKHVVVLGRSAIVGLPLSLLLLHHHATLSNCHHLTPPSLTRSLCQQADVVIAATGSPLLVKRDWLKRGAVVLDVGINFVRDTEGGEEAGGARLVGDVDFDSVLGHAGAVSPVPGGIGPMTVACLLLNTTNNWLRSHQQLKR